RGGGRRGVGGRSGIHLPSGLSGRRNGYITCRQDTPERRSTGTAHGQGFSGRNAEETGIGRKTADLYEVFSGYDADGECRDPGDIPGAGVQDANKDPGSPADTSGRCLTGTVSVRLAAALILYNGFVDSVFMTPQLHLHGRWIRSDFHAAEMIKKEQDA